MPGPFDDIIESTKKPAEGKAEDHPSGEAQQKAPTGEVGKAVGKPEGQGQPVCDQFKQIYGERKKPS